MRKIILAAAAALAFAAPATPAQSVGKMVVNDLKYSAGDILGIWTSPFRGSGRDWLLVAASAGVFGLSMLVDEPISDWALDNEGSGLLKTIEPVRRGGVAYTGKFIVPPVAAAYVIGLATKNQGIRDGVMGCATSWLAQSGPRKLTYLLVERQRPDTSPDNSQKWGVPGDWEDWQKHSFPAGHFANAMSCATFWSERFDLGWWSIPVYAAAGAIGIGRLADGGHWTSDTVLGGILGYAVGREIAHRSLDRKEERQKGKTGIIFSPERSGTTIGMRISF